MNVTFFGTAGSIQSANSSNTSFLLATRETSVLIDASGSPELHLQRAGTSVRDVDAVVLTHEHVDHLYAVPSILHQMYLMKRTKPLALIANPSTAQKCVALGETLALWDRDWRCDIRWHVVEDQSVDVAPDLTLSVFPVEHSVPALGLKAGDAAGGTLVYSGDTGPSTRVLGEALDAQWLIHEVGNGTRVAQANGHATVRQAAEVAHEAAVRTLFMVHIDYHLEDPSKAAASARAHYAGHVVIPETDKLYVLADMETVKSP